MDYLDAEGAMTHQPYAFLLRENEFDQIFERIRERRLPYWADPHRNELNQINNWDDGRGLYFDDPNGHLLKSLPVLMDAVGQLCLFHTGEMSAVKLC